MTATPKIYTSVTPLTLHDALPIAVGEHRARIDQQARRRDHRIPEHLRRVEFRARVVIGDVAAVVVVAVGDDRIAVVAAAFDQVEFVAISEEHTSELQSLMRISYAVFCMKKNKHNSTNIEQQ